MVDRNKLEICSYILPWLEYAQGPGVMFFTGLLWAAPRYEAVVFSIRGKVQHLLQSL